MNDVEREIHGHDDDAINDEEILAEIRYGIEQMKNGELDGVPPWSNKEDVLEFLKSEEKRLIEKVI
jgi:hypothetical protein